MTDRTPCPTPTSVVPLTVYVLWHPDFEDGPLLANAIYDWLGPSRSDLRRVGMGINVYFRSEDWTDEYELDPVTGPQLPAPIDEVERADRAARLRRRRPIDFRDAAINVVIPLVDAHMLVDPSWQRQLHELAHPPPELHDRIQLAPVQLVSSLAALGGWGESIQPLRIDSWRDLQTDSVESRAHRLARRVVRLRREVVQVVLRLLTRSADPADLWSRQPLRRVFLSYAKDDYEAGPGVAERLRDVGRSYGYIETFFDENNIEPGALDGASRRRAEAGHGEGFVAVLSDKYAKRTLTRRELSAARTPQLERPTAHGVSIWRVRPTVAVTTLKNEWSQIPDDLATVPVMRYAPGREREVFDHLLREATFQAYLLKWAFRVASRCAADTMRATYSDIHVVTWTPDRPTLTALRAEARGRHRWNPRPTQKVLVIYPGFGFLPGEEDRLADDFEDEVKILSYDSVLSPPRPPTFGHVRLWLSAGDAPVKEQAARGYDTGRFLPEHEVQRLLDADEPPEGLSLERRPSAHIDSAVLRILRHVLPRADVAFGNELRGTSGDFGDLMLDLLSDPSLRRLRPVGHRPLMSFSSWPHHAPADAVARTRLVELRSQFSHVASFYEIPPVAVPGLAHAPSAAVLGADERKWLAATASTLARRTLAQRTDVTVALGGRTTGYDGLMPGIVEEVLYSMLASMGLLDRLPFPDLAADTADHHADTDAALVAEVRDKLEPAHISVAVLGEFGGAARLMVQAIRRRPETGLPELLTLRGQLDAPENRDTVGRMLPLRTETRRYVQRCYAYLKGLVEGFRKLMHGSFDDSTMLPALGITLGDWKTLQVSDGSGTLSRLVAELRPTSRLVSRRKYTSYERPYAQRLQTAVALAWAARNPTEADVLVLVDRAVRAGAHSLKALIASALSPPTAADVSPEEAAEHRARRFVDSGLCAALSEHLGLHHPALWGWLAASDFDTVAKLVHRHDLPDSLLHIEAPSLPRRLARLGVHFVWAQHDPSCGALVRRLTHLLQTLSDGSDSVGEGLDVRHWPFGQSGPASPAFGLHQDAIVVLVGRLTDLESWIAASRSEWREAARQHPRLRQLMAVRVPADERQSTQRPANVAGSRVLWDDTPDPIDVNHTSSDGLNREVGSFEDVCALVLARVVELLAVRVPERDAQAELSTPVLLDRTGQPVESQSLVQRQALFRRQGMVYEVLPAPTDAERAAADAREPTGDVELHVIDTARPHQPSGQARVLLGRFTSLVVDTRLEGIGRFTAYARAECPATVLLAARLVAARRAWASETVRRLSPLPADAELVPSPLLQHFQPRTGGLRGLVLVPEPPPEPHELATLHEVGVHAKVVSPTSARGRLEAGWDVQVVCLRPTDSQRRPLGTPEGAESRVFAVLDQALSWATARVHRVHTPEQIERESGMGTRRAVVLVGVPGGPVDHDPWLLAVQRAAGRNPVPVFPLGLLGGRFHYATATQDGAAWTEQMRTIGQSNGLGTSLTMELADCSTPFDAARLILTGLKRAEGQRWGWR